MAPHKLNTAFLNAGHFIDHLLLLVFATCALRLTAEWGMTYGQLIPFATPGFVAFGVCTLPAGWLADRWSREGMMVVFFLGIGGSCVLAGLATGPYQLAACLTLLGAFAAIYHPVGLAMVVQGASNTGMSLAINGVFGNMGVAVAALLTGFLIDAAGWRTAFIVPGAITIVVGIGYLAFVRGQTRYMPAAAHAVDNMPPPLRLHKTKLLRVFGIIVFTTALGGLVFQSTTFALPKILDERLAGFAYSTSTVGQLVFAVFAVAAFAQLVVGHLLDNHRIRPVFVVVAGLQSVLFLAMTQLQGLAALLCASAFMLVVFGQIPINDVLVARHASGEWRSRAYALRYVVTFCVMACAVPLIAWIHEHRGFDLLFAILALAGFLVSVAAGLLPAVPRHGDHRRPGRSGESLRRVSGFDTKL